MERKKIWQEVQVDGISMYNDYDDFMYYLNVTREKIKELYPEVEDQDIDVNILNEDCIQVTFEFLRFETVKEQKARLNSEERRKELEKEKILNEIQSFFKLYPELKETVLNSERYEKSNL